MIVPAIMPFSYNDLQKKVNHVRDLVSLAQIDVMDGKFVPALSWPYTGDEGQFLEMTKNAGLPESRRIAYQIDLMIENPKEVAQEWLDAGAIRLIFHVETLSSGDEEFIRNMRSQGIVTTGIAISNDTPLEALDPYVEIVNYVQLMGIQKIGFQGQEFDERVIDRLLYLKRQHPHLLLAVDGSVNESTAARLKEAGAGNLVVGSAIFQSKDPGSVIDKLGVI